MKSCWANSCCKQKEILQTKIEKKIVEGFKSCSTTEQGADQCSSVQKRITMLVNNTNSNVSHVDTSFEFGFLH